MKWFLSAFVAVSLMLGAQAAMAGAGHYHGPVSKEQAGKIAVNIVQNMTKQGSLPTSWAGTSMGSLERTPLNGNLVWRAEFFNAEEPVAEKRKVIVFLTLTGAFIKAEYAEYAAK